MGWSLSGDLAIATLHQTIQGPFISGLPTLDGLKPSTFFLRKDMPLSGPISRQRARSSTSLRSFRTWAVPSIERLRCDSTQLRSDSNHICQSAEQRMIGIGSIKAMISIGPACDETGGAEFAQLVLHRVEREAAQSHKLPYVMGPARCAP